MMLLEAGLKSLQDLISVVNAWLLDIDLLKSSRKRTVFIKDPTIFLESGRTNTT